MRTLLSFAVLSLGVWAAPKETALDRYVKAPDSHFKYTLEKAIPSQGATGYVLDMISQQYLTAAEVDRPLWQHWLTIIKPDTVKTNIALLIIGGGSNPSRAPERVDPGLSAIAAATGAVIADLRQIPNEPVTFAGETKKRTEDAIIAYTWDKFLRTGDEKWPLRLPMTKAAVRAMDAVSGFLASDAGGKVKVDRFILTGGSKRGWTTWTTAAVDSRVIAIAPFVIDMLNVVPSFQHHYRVYGFWAPAVGDYVAQGIMNWTNTEQYKKLMEIEEPYSYRDRLTMPKLIVNSTGDQFFLPDSSQFYFKDLKGEKYLRYVPNTDHAVNRNSDALQTLAAFADSVIRGGTRPQFSWKIDKSGAIHVNTKTKPLAVKVWQATNPQARDFRLEKIGPTYKATDLAEQGKGKYVARVPAPPKGYTAFFVELTFDVGGKLPMKLTTDVKVLPDTYPSGPPALTPPAGASPLK